MRARAENGHGMPRKQHGIPVGEHPSRRSPEKKPHTPVDLFDVLGPVSIFFVNRGLDSTIVGESEEMRIHTPWKE